MIPAITTTLLAFTENKLVELPMWLEEYRLLKSVVEESKEIFFKINNGNENGGAHSLVSIYLSDEGVLPSYQIQMNFHQLYYHRS